MEPSELLRRLVDVLDRQQIRYLVTGSVATTTYGESRFTNDIDVVVELGMGNVDAFCATFAAPEFYCSRDSVIEAIRQHFQFNILHPKSGFKIDVFIPEDSDFNRSRFNRRVRIAGADGHETWFASPEDVIIKKMTYYQKGRSEKHLRDIAGVLKIKEDKVDREYIAAWAGRLQLLDIWREILKQAAKS
ncbi:MAG: hypothetical protein EXR98_14780 [Gemmataceae bacterium]|nr:hypothetical protein [Gemmataceae bacterium]